MLLLNTLKSSADFLGFPGGSHSKMESAYNARDLGSIPGSGRSPGEGNGNPPQYSCLENSMDRGAWQATVHGVAKSWTQLSNSPHTHTHTHTHCFFALSAYILSKSWYGTPSSLHSGEYPACHVGDQDSPSGRQHTLWASLVAQLVKNSYSISDLIMD